MTTAVGYPEFPPFDADVVSNLIAEGQYWWLRDGQYVATDSREEQEEGDVYILETSPEWLAGFENNEQLADLINEVIQQNLEAMNGDH